MLRTVHPESRIWILIFYPSQIPDAGSRGQKGTGSGSATSVADPDPGSGIGCVFDPGIRDGRQSASGSGIRDEQPGSYFLELRNHFFAIFGVKILKFFDEDPGSGMETVRIRDPGWKKVGSGIRDKHPGSAKLSATQVLCVGRGRSCLCLTSLRTGGTGRSAARTTWRPGAAGRPGGSRRTR
jgi:hypothetical protein